MISIKVPSLARCWSLSEGDWVNHAGSPMARARFGMPSVCNYTAKVRQIQPSTKKCQEYGFTGKWLKPKYLQPSVKNFLQKEMTL